MSAAARSSAAERMFNHGHLVGRTRTRQPYQESIGCNMPARCSLACFQQNDAAEHFRPPAFGVIVPASVACCFTAYGVQIELTTVDIQVIELIASRQFEALLPPGWRPAQRQRLAERSARY